MFNQSILKQAEQTNINVVVETDNTASLPFDIVSVKTTIPADADLVIFLQYVDNKNYEYESIRNFFTMYRNGCKRMLEERGVGLSDIPGNPAIAALQIAVNSWTPFTQGSQYGRLDADTRELARWFHEYRRQVVVLLDGFGKRKFTN